VTDENEPPVHYQLSVTGRQAAGFFLGLLVCLGLAFFFGMKTGSAAHRGPEPARDSAGVGGAAARPVPEATEPPLGIETPRAGARTDREEAPAARPTAAPKAPEEPAAREEKAASPAAKTGKPVEKEPEKAAEKPAHRKGAAKAPDAHAAEKPSEKEAAPGPWFVQVFVTKSAEKADSFTKKLKKDGFAADVTPVPGKPGLFRVRVGPFPDREKADEMAKRVQKAEQLKESPRVMP
jgi:cell division protein FtsN